MPTRFKNLILMLLVPIGLVALFAMLSANKAENIASAQSAGVAEKPGYAPEGVWSDLPALPTVTLGFGPGTYGSDTPGPLKLKRASAVAYPPNGKVYILGGRHKADGDDITSPWIWEFTPGGSTYTRKTTLLDSTLYGTNAAANMATVVLTNSAGVRIYAVGGATVNSVASNLTRVYDPVADSMTQDDVWPASPARIPGGYAVYNNKLYIFGGYDPTYTNINYSDTWVFDPMAAAGSRWTQLASAHLSVPRAFIAGAELDGYVYAIGGDVITGVVSTTVVPQTVVERMHPADASPTWQPVASLPTARGDMGVWSYDSGLAYEITGKIVVGGGGFPVPDNTSYIYNPGTDSWSTFASLLRNRRNVAYTQYGGILYAFGGYNVGTSYDGANDSMSYDGSTGGGTNTPTPTGTLPTATPTFTRTNTPTATATVCGATGPYATSTVANPTIVPGTTDTGNHTDDGGTQITLPFPFRLYDQTFTTANVTSNGQLDFDTEDDAYTNACLPDATASYAIFPYWDDLRTDNANGTGEGIYTSVSGTTPNRIFNIEWRAEYYNGGAPANFEVRLYEGTGTSQFDVIYGTDLSGGNSGATSGVQRDTGSVYTEYFCNGTGGPATGGVHFSQASCNTPAPTNTSTSVPATSTATATATHTLEATNTSVPPTNTGVPATNTSVSATDTSVPGTETSVPATDTPEQGTATATATACSIVFSDVPEGSTFYSYIECLACQGIINGYSDGTFLPENFVTRGQLSKITANAAGWSEDVTGQTFEDVGPSSTFYLYIERMAAHGVISGYPCGGAGEPCGQGNLPYFRPDANATRGQISKVISEAAGFTDPPGAQVYEDVPVSSAFFDYIYRLNAHGVINGYPCGGTHEPCGSGNLPYFRPLSNATRGQASKLISLAFLIECSTAKR